ncbi:MAG: hypothetical protein Q8L48_03250 [Archangium sp.]|nr:hypothetical protein [Archangium sp.]
MSLTPAQWMEVTFNLAYLGVVYTLVGLMSVALRTKADPKLLLRRFRDGFLLLALGDTGHVGFRVIALLRDGLEARVEVAGTSVGLVGVGALATAVTITFLYLVLLDLWRRRFEAPRGTLYWGLVALGVVRLLLLVPAQNQWSQVVPPWDWSVARNVPLTILGLAVATLMIRDGRRAADKTFTQLGLLIVCSYAFYLPVILFVQQVPAIGLLMVPKTLVYLVMAWLGYVRLFKARDSDAGGAPASRGLDWRAAQPKA